MRKDLKTSPASIRYQPYQALFYAVKPVPQLLDKINKLYNLLLHGKRMYEDVVNNISGRDLRCALISLALASNQYARELSCEIEMLGGVLVDEKADNLEIMSEFKTLRREDEILNFCMAKEKKIVKAYHELLNEFVLCEGLRSMFHYQLNGMLYAFAQVKELSSLMIHL